ncbi:hypothetical protein A8926_2700 [Saccharopolyspora spinosa]|uniref:Uncharacterized protein n=1 Tax=Saccharopolyspora spinosa TaxID=60894 RepID=A0A2N3XWM3_SACSN|nr:hypothetical protein A8926_2700 [Saccharopolyspora spinosa]
MASFQARPKPHTSGVNQTLGSPVGAAGQSCNPLSPLYRFLDDWLPQRKLIVEQWTRELSSEPDRPLQVFDGANAKWLRSAADLRIGLDLAAEPGYWNLVSFLPPSITVR